MLQNPWNGVSFLNHEVHEVSEDHEESRHGFVVIVCGLRALRFSSCLRVMESARRVGRTTVAQATAVKERARGPFRTTRNYPLAGGAPARFSATHKCRNAQI